MKIIYHSADYDGLLSGAICKYFLSKRCDSIEMLPWDYTDAPVVLDDPNEPVYLVDLSMESIMGHPNLVWIDHHKSAIEKWDGAGIEGMRRIGTAACKLCWEWFTTTRVPRLVQLVGMYDVWDKSDPDAENLQYGLKAMGANLEFFYDHVALYFESPELSSVILATLYVNGKSVKAFAGKQNKEIVERYGYLLPFEGLTFMALNTPAGNSALFETADLKGADACLRWYYQRGKGVSVSLYHAPGKTDVDLSVIAAKYGGGGHKGACGFNIKDTDMTGGFLCLEWVQAQFADAR